LRGGEAALALPVLTLCAALSAACTTIPAQPAASLPVLLGLRSIEVQREYVDRYSCGTTTPLYCTCDSKMAASMCHCRCPTY
jgi:hypothetical protein